MSRNRNRFSVGADLLFLAGLLILNFYGRKSGGVYHHLRFRRLEFLSVLEKMPQAVLYGVPIAVFAVLLFYGVRRRGAAVFKASSFVLWGIFVAGLFSERMQDLDIIFYLMIGAGVLLLIHLLIMLIDCKRNPLSR